MTADALPADLVIKGDAAGDGLAVDVTAGTAAISSEVEPSRMLERR